MITLTLTLEEGEQGFDHTIVVDESKLKGMLEQTASVILQIELGQIVERLSKTKRITDSLFNLSEEGKPKTWVDDVLDEIEKGEIT